MAWNEINYSCGHTERVQMYGKMSDRDSKKEWLENNGLCPDCYKQSLALIAKKQSDDAGLPELQGSEKQVSWANKIRLDALKMTCNKNAKACIAELNRQRVSFNGLSKEDGQAIIDNCQSHIEFLKNQTSAKWFIDNRSSVDGYVLTQTKIFINKLNQK